MGIDVIVIGGGIAGLSCAWRLSAAGKKVLVLEKDSAAGGNVRTELVDGYRIERGPHTFMASADDVFSLAREAGLADEIVPTLPAAKKRFIVRGGRLHAMPTGPLSFAASRLLSLRGKLALAGEPFRTRRGEPTDTAAQFFDRRFGREAARVLAGAFISGVYAGDPNTLSAPAAFPLFWRFEQESGGMIRGAMKHRKLRRAEREARGDRGPRLRGLFSFRGGLGQLSAGVAARLGEAVRTRAAVSSLVREDGCWVVRGEAGELRCPNLVLAVPPSEAGKLLAQIDAELAVRLQGIRMAPVAVVHAGYRNRAVSVPDGFGFLAPRNEGIRSLGILFPSRLFQDRAPDGGELLSGFVGGMQDPSALDLDDGELQAVMGHDLAKLLHLTERPDFVKVTRFPQAIPQFTLGHLQLMAAIEERLERVPGLALPGNYLRGVGMKDAVGSGFAAAARFRQGWSAVKGHARGDVPAVLPLAVVGCDFRVASSAWRSRLILSDEEAETLAGALRLNGAADGFVDLNTCNRTEWIVSGRDPQWAASLLRSQMIQRAGPGSQGWFAPYVHTGEDAAAHLFKVALGQESLVIGERQVAGQLNDALELARARGSSSRILNGLGAAAGRLVQMAFKQGCMAGASVGVHSLAVSWLAGRLEPGRLEPGRLEPGRLEPGRLPRVALAGLGQIGRRVLDLLHRQKRFEVISFNRTIPTGRSGTVRPLAELPAALGEVDAVILCTGAREPVLTAQHLAAIPADRGLLVVDIGIPRQVECSAIPENVRVCGLDELTAYHQGARPRPPAASAGDIRVLLDKALTEFRAFCNQPAFAEIIDSVQRNHGLLVREQIPKVIDTRLGYLPEDVRARLGRDLRAIVLSYTSDVFRAVKEASARYGGETWRGES